MYVFIVFGIIFLVFSLMLFFAPSAIRKLDKWGRKELFDDRKAGAHRIMLGILFLIVSGLMFYFAFFKC